VGTSWQERWWWGCTTAVMRRPTNCSKTSVGLGSGKVVPAIQNDSRRFFRTDLQSSSSPRVITIRRDTAPGAAKIARRCYARTVGFCRLKWKIAVTKRAYRRARRKRLRAEIRLQLLLRSYADAVGAIQTAHKEFIEASKRYEAALKAYLDHLADF
jgi:hypothetical protein